MKLKGDKRKQVLLGGSDLKEVIDGARRSFFLRSGGFGLSLGAVAAADVLGITSANAATEKTTHDAPNLGVKGTGQFPARAQRVIYLHMMGAWSTVDLFEHKPALIKMDGQPMPPSVLGTQKLSTMSSGQSSFIVKGPVAPLHQYGQSGAWVSDLLPHMAGIVDDLCFVKTMFNNQLNHDPAAMLTHTGFQLAGRPSAGAWLTYALGGGNTDLPSFVVMADTGASSTPTQEAFWGAGFLPSEFQGVQFRPGDDPVLYLKNLGGVTSEDRRRLLDSLEQLSNADFQASGDPEIFSRMRQYEMAYRMQRSIPEVTDFSDEPKSVLDLYGPDALKPGSFAHNCLIARRLCERGVKFTILYNNGWDHHMAIVAGLPPRCKDVDQPVAGLIRDLKQRGMLEDTLVVCGAEFGRTPFAQTTLAGGWGRDHHGGNYTWLLAGAGTNAGYSYGETDDFNYNPVSPSVKTYDINATMLRLFGIDHTKLTYFYQGRNYRLTDVYGQVVDELIA